MVDDDAVFGEVVRVDGVNAYVVRAVFGSSRESGVGEFVGVESAEGVVVSVVTGVERLIPEDVVSMLSFEMESKYLPYSADLGTSYYLVFGLGLLCVSISYFNRYREALGDDVLLAIVDELWRVLPEAQTMLVPVRKYLRGGGVL
ncbi:hypothetical protein B6U67_01905 [Methanosarcinales archaeon ex4484_138]|nr:MAG: hypothetical protein B6U67_01905 [Methanosarcinales archaeon ex4484_138]